MNLQTIDDYIGLLKKDDPLLFEGHLSHIDFSEFNRYAEPSVNRVIKAIEYHERILIFGHDDADGITSLYIMYDYLKQIGCDLYYYLPNREVENHGIREGVIQYAIENQVSLVIVVDNGISSFEGVARLNQAGIECVILDHHLIPEKLPEACAILNPKLFKGDYAERTSSSFASIKNKGLDTEQSYQTDLKMLAGVGVCFFFLNCLSQKPDMKPLKNDYLFWTALGSIADRVPMTGVNHLIVRQLLNEWKQCTNIPIIQFLIEKTACLNENSDRLLFLKSLILFFYFGRQLNGKHLCFSFLLSDTREEMEGFYNQLMILKDENQALTDRNEAIINQEVIHEVDNLLQGNRLDDVLNSNVIHKLVNDYLHLFYQKNQIISLVYVDIHARLAYPLIGRLAGNLVNRYHCPVMILQAKNSDQAEESQMVCEARCLEGFHWLNCFNSFSDTLVNFGGHVKAAGFLMNTKNLLELINRYHDYLRQHFATIQSDNIIENNKSDNITKDYTLIRYTADIWQTLCAFYKSCLPFGEGFSEPVFCIKSDLTNLCTSCIDNSEYFVQNDIFNKMTIEKNPITELVLTASADWKKLRVISYQ